MRSERARERPSLLAEAILVAILGLAVALLANQISPRGLKLGRDYFPATAAPTTSKDTPVVSPDLTASTNDSAIKSPSSGEAVASRLQAAGLRLIDRGEVMRLFEDPRREQEQIVFIDARNDRHYQEGHIPDAYAFDRYYPENHLPTVLPVCQQAESIVVYCNGGDCEDSEFAALALRDAGIPMERIRVYAAGMSDWTAAGFPVEVGARGSGDRRAATP